ncbi:unnamed protein product [Acanthoscelides obtectus]|uniref:Uncharacterized protein n=1 Tax=Acanthoscelides obtectus TaxID=200917 RepID=A0A9P0Q0D4_ACAOB|nr:unnamed protein product [Acanthoscelides obtectus]CAK1675401.1 hypothetical protein AOBTE_LOCUS30202 [Acanthoscelides obtectus]
MKVSVFKFF